MARVLFCWEIGNGLAYIEGLTAGAKVIAKAGHEVHFAARDLTHAERLLGSRFPYYQAPTTVIPPGMVLKRPMTFADVLINLGYGKPGAVAGRVRAWRNLIDMVKPDIIRCAHAPGALLAARGTGIRSVVVGIGFLVPPAKSPLPLLRTWAKDAKPENMAAREQAVLEGMNQGLDAIGAPRIANIGALYNEADRRELYTYPELDDYGPRDNVTYLGNFQPGMGEVPQWPDLPGKKIFAYLEAFKQVDTVLQALAATGQPVLVYMPRPPSELLQKYASGNLRIVDRPLDLLKTAALCDVGLSLSGHNIVGTFLAAGKPQLCLPSVFTERVTANKIETLGAGLVAELDDLGGKLSRLLREESFAAKARETAKRIAHLDMNYGLKGAVAGVDEMAKLGPRK
jgi:UDP:flavonoid glycosyltransferase YjiC (YdhE family)